VQVDLSPPEFPNFWIKKLGDVQKRYEGEDVVETQRYLLFPQKAGDFKLGPLTARIARRVRVKPPIKDPFFDDDFFNGFFARLQWTRIASNTLSLHVDPLPGNVELYGTFTIRATADKTVVDADQPVRVTIEIEGEGNVDDIEKFDPHIPDTVVYSDDPVVKERMKDGKYGGTFRQTITIVSDHDFTVPSFTLRYYDSIRKQVVEKRTPPIRVKVRGGRKAAASASTTPLPPAEKGTEAPLGTPRPTERQAGGSTFVGWIYLLVGLLLGAGATYGAGRLKRRLSSRRKMGDIARAIRRARDDKTLMELLLPYAGEDETIRSALQRLEENIYRNGRHRIDRELLAEIVDELEHGER
jgi:hypothetical protein